MKVYSSVVDEIDYDEANQSLTVKWAKSGRVSRYAGVSPDQASRIMKAPSVGSALHAEIKKGDYEHEYLPQEE